MTVALLVLILPKTASAQAPAASEQPTTGTVALQPGANEIGWIAETSDPQVLFDEIAELQSIWTWHALDRRWQAAARDAPSSLWTLYRLVPGMGLRLQIAGDAPVQWQRSLVPVSGKVELQPGDNFVAWAGRDGWDVNQLAKGIGRQLQEIHRRNPGTGELDAIWPVAEEAEPATVARGEALWVKMPRSIVWLQPTDVMPRLVFPGGAPENVQTAARRDLRNTLDYFATEYGIQAEATELAIYMPLELDAYKQQLRDEGEEINDIALNDLWSRTGGWAGERIVVKRYGNEDPDLPTADISYQETMTHEYFHRIQGELWNGGDHDATWVVEGSANYAEQDQQVAAGERTWTEISSDDEQWIYDDVPRLLSTELGNGTWQYYLGRLALQRLVERSRSSAWVDFYRELAPTQIGPTNRWQSTPPWRDVFALTFDVDLDEFYAAFDQWQADLAARNGSRPADEAFDEPTRIEGRVVRADGSPVAGRFVSADEIVLAPTSERYSVGWTQRAETDAEGNFSVIAPNDGQYMLWIYFDNERNCLMYYSKEGAVYAREDADLLVVNGATLRNVRFMVAADACRHKLRGTVRGPDGEPLAGIRARLLSSQAWEGALTDSDGTFSVIVPQDGYYRIYLDLSYRIHLDLVGSCLVYFVNGGRVTTYGRAASLVRVVGADTHIDIQVPENVCGNTISGRLLDASGEPMVGVRVDMLPTDDVHSYLARTDSVGSFSVVVPRDGDYHISIWPTEDCAIFVASAGMTADRDMAATVRIAGGDIRGDITVPDSWCGHAINGRLLDASGRAMAYVHVNVYQTTNTNQSATHTDSAGMFSVPVSQDGIYRITVEPVESCSVYYADGGVTADRDLASLVRVAGKDVQVEIRVPEDVCGNAINGRLLDSSAEPMARGRVNAIADIPWSAAAIDSAGKFSVTVPEDGIYRILITPVIGCSVYYTDGGVTADYDAATMIQIAGEDAYVGDITIPDGWCEHSISGRLLDAAGEPMAGVQLYAIDVDGAYWARTDNDGAFNVTVTQDGGYRIGIASAEGCYLYVVGGGVTASYVRASLVRVAGGDVRVGDIRVPAGICDG